MNCKINSIGVLKSFILYINDITIFRKYIKMVLCLLTGVGITAIRKLEDLKVLKRSPDLLNKVKIGQGQLRLIIQTYFVLPYMSRGMRFPTMWYVRPIKPQFRLRIRTV